MTLAWLPIATRQDHSRAFPWQVSCPVKGVLHTTETSTQPDYEADGKPWQNVPHAEVVPFAGSHVAVIQYVPFDRGSFSLVHPQGTAPTNGAHAIQFEMRGTCAPNGPGYHWPTADDAVLLDLFTKVIKPVSDAFRIPLVTPPWQAYPGAYGSRHHAAGDGLTNTVRLSDAGWTGWSGWVGHQHVPGNVHGDPGAFPWARMMTVAHQNPRPPTGVEYIHGLTQYGRKDHGSDHSVAVVQRHAGGGIDVDGVFGRQTKIAVENFQSRRGLPVDGVVGPQTARRFGPGVVYLPS